MTNAIHRVLSTTAKSWNLPSAGFLLLGEPYDLVDR